MRINLQVEKSIRVRNDLVVFKIHLLATNISQQVCMSQCCKVQNELLNWLHFAYDETGALIETLPMECRVKWKKASVSETSKKEIEHMEMNGWYAMGSVYLSVPLAEERKTPFSALYDQIVKISSLNKVSADVNPVYALSESLQKRTKSDLRKGMMQEAIRLAKELTGLENETYTVNEIRYGMAESGFGKRNFLESKCSQLDSEQPMMEPLAVDEIIKLENATTVTISEKCEFEVEMIE